MLNNKSKEIKNHRLSDTDSPQINTSSSQPKPFQYRRRNYLMNPLFMTMTSGKGQFHSNEPNPNKPNKKLFAYYEITRPYILNKVDNPQMVDKSQAEWLIASNLRSRIYGEQELKGMFGWIWADLDENTLLLAELAEKLEIILDGADYEIYTTRSATKENPKARILIPLERLLTGSEYIIAQGILNDRLESIGITPDRSTEGAAQLCYLPNKGEFYDSKSKRKLEFFDPLIEWSYLIPKKHQELESQRLALKEAKIAAAKRKENLKLSDAPDLIGLFNKAYTPQYWLLKAGYKQHGDSFCHPGSKSGNYSATVRQDSNGVLRVNALSTKDPLYSEGNGAHDAFSVFCTLMHDGDIDEALKNAGNNLLKISGMSYNKAMQIEYTKKKFANKSTQSMQNADKAAKNCSLKRFSISGQSRQMESRMLADVFVFDRIVLRGQLTIFYAPPNTGKTLLIIWMLIDSIGAKRIEGKYVFYINADDDYKGLVLKTTIAEEYGFEMLAPGFEGFKSESLKDSMQQMIDDDTAQGIIIILDTLKKFIDLMNKTDSANFLKVAREFVSRSGTLIMLAHTNKNRDKTGKLIPAGTSDTRDDCDCAYTLDEVSRTKTTKQVLFENIKSRGAVANGLAFSYSIKENDDYIDRLLSVELEDKAATAIAKKNKKIADDHKKDRLAIDALTEAIEQGITLKTELIESARNNSGISKRMLLNVLDKYIGSSLINGNLWSESIGAKNAKSYHLLSVKVKPKNH